MNPIYILAIATVGLIFAGVYFVFFARHDQVRSFLGQVLDDDGSAREEQMKRLRQQQFILKKRRKYTSQFMQNLDNDIERANLLLKPNEVLMIAAGTTLLGFLLPYLLDKGIFLSMLGGVVGLFLPKMYLKITIWLRMKKAEAQFSDVIDTLVNCFKSGYGFSRALQVVGDTYDDPWGTEFSKIATEMNFGSSQEDALQGLTKRIPNPDVNLFVTAILIQKDTGGNLAELLSILSNTIRERYKLFSKVQALSAQGKLSAIIIFLVPFCLAGMFTLIVPDMMHMFAQNIIGKFAIGLAITLQLIGGLVLKKIATLEV